MPQQPTFAYATDLHAGDLTRETEGVLLEVLITRTYGADLTAFNFTVDGVHTSG